MGIETYIEGIDFTYQNNLLIIANLILITIAFFLLIRLRISKKKREARVKPERFDIKSDFFSPVKPSTTVPTPVIETAGAAIDAPDKMWMRETEKTEVPEAEVLDKDELELEDELPEEFVVPQVRKLNIPTPVVEKEKPEEEKEPEVVIEPPEIEIAQPIKEEVKAAEPPELKLFKFEMEEKKSKRKSLF